MLVGTLASCGFSTATTAVEPAGELRATTEHYDVIIDTTMPEECDGNYGAYRVFHETGHVEYGCWTLADDYKHVDAWWPDMTVNQFTYEQFVQE